MRYEFYYLPNRDLQMETLFNECLFARLSVVLMMNALQRLFFATSRGSMCHVSSTCSYKTRTKILFLNIFWAADQLSHTHV